jgi:hypothetical protein
MIWMLHNSVQNGLRDFILQVKWAVIVYRIKEINSGDHAYKYIAFMVGRTEYHGQIL